MRGCFPRFGVLLRSSPAKCDSPQPSTGTSAVTSHRKRPLRWPDWIGRTSSSHWRAKARKPSSSTLLTSIENSNVAEPAVVNASPLIFLSRAGLIDLLKVVSAEIIVPEIVAAEINVRGQNDSTAQAIASTAWLTVTQTTPVPPPIQAWGLGPGESAVSWAHAHVGSKAIID